MRKISVSTLGLIICIVFPAIALGQNAGVEYMGQKSQKKHFVSHEIQAPLSCPYPPDPYPPRPAGPPMIEGELPPYQGNLKATPEGYYRKKTKLPVKTTPREKSTGGKGHLGTL